MKINISFCFDKNYYRQAIVAISSLFLNAKKNKNKIHYNLFLLVNKNVNTKIQNEIIKKVSNFYNNFSIEFKIIENIFDKSYECRGISKACYYRLLLHKIFPQLDNIIYSDVDVIFNTDLSELLNFNIEDFYFASNKDIIYNTQDGRNRVLNLYDYWNNELKDIDLNYRNSGFLILNLKKIRELNIDEKIIELSQKAFNYQDQDVLNILFIDKQDEVGTLSPKYATLAGAREKGLYKIALDENIITKSEYKEVLNNPAIIHYAGIKPWNSYNKAEGFLWWDFVEKNDIYFDFFQKSLNRKIQKQLFLQNIFSIKNEILNSKKYKIIKILGLKIKLSSI